MQRLNFHFQIAFLTQFFKNKKAIDFDFILGNDWVATMNERDCEFWIAHHLRRKDWHTRSSENYAAKTYRHLRWSTTLKADAQAYADHLLTTCWAPGPPQHDKTEQGENIARSKGSGGWTQLYSADKITARFIDNEESWPWGRSGMGHITMALWYPTRYFGCAESVKNWTDGDNAGKTCRHTVCRFAKSGNCAMGAFNSIGNRNWRKAMMQDDSGCGPLCPPGGCFL